MADDVLTIFAEGRVDAKSLSNYMSEPIGKLVSRRLAPPVESFDTHIDKLTKAETAAALLVQTIPGTVSDAINNTAVPGGVLADTFVTATANGIETVARTQRDVNSERVSVKDFFHIGEVDYTQAFKRAIANLVSLGGGEVFVPRGKYQISAQIDIPTNIAILGLHRGSCEVFSTGNHIGFTFLSTMSEISNLAIKGMAVGVIGSADARYCKLTNCNITGNRIGFIWKHGYINTISGNNIAFNTYGGVLEGQSFQLNIHDNVIDNNLGGLGLLVLGIAGASIRDNTIEGNRVVATGQGVGLAVFGNPQRLLVDTNWLEDNGSTHLPNTTTPNPYSCDILLGDGVTEVAVELINKCIPLEYRAECLGTLSTSGNIVLSNNFHFISRHGVMLRIQSTAIDLSISNMTFNGSNDGQKPISIEYVSGQVDIGQINIDKIFTQVLGGDVSYVRQGIGGSPVHCNKITPYNLIKVDGVDLYTKRMTCKDFLTLPNATLDVEVRLPASGWSQIKNTVKAQLGDKGLITNDDNGRVRVGETPVLTTTTEQQVLIGIGKPGGGLIAYLEGSPNVFAISEGLANVFLISQPLTFTQTELTFTTGEYYGYCVMTKAQADIHIKGARRLELTDLMIESMLHKATEPPSAAQQYSYAGDIIYNSNPTAGGAFGWVCVTTGNPGNWESIGNIGTI